MTDMLNRRHFIKGVTAAASLTPVLFSSGGLFAAGQEKLSVALVGCGGRGQGALNDFLEAARHVGIETEVVGLADFFKDRALAAAEKFGTPPERVFEGATGYQDVMKTAADVVLLVTPPNFRPVHLEAAIEAGKHVFMEKPVAVDPPGARKIMELGRIAKAKGLAIAAGTQRRHQLQYLKTQYAVAKGAIGPIRGGAVYWCTGALWYKDRDPGEDDASYMVRNWVSFAEMSGDHIVEQHVHNIDVANWFIGRHPVSAIGFGGRARRKTGNQFDYFSIDFDYGEDVRIHSMCRQINGTYGRVSELFTGTLGSTWGTGPGKEGFAKEVSVPEMPHVGNPYVQEHLNLINSIRSGSPLNEAEDVATSTLSGIMGRISAYTGQMIRWKDLTDESTGSPWYGLTLSPTARDFENGTVTAPPDDVVPVPGKA